MLVVDPFTYLSYQAMALVVASGYDREPHRPTWPGQEAYRGRILHSSTYLDGREFRGLRVLVVGLGNSGGEIAVDLCEHGADTHLAVRGPVNIVPRDILGIPAQRFTIAQRHWPPAVADAINRAIVRLVTPDLEPYGLLRPDTGPLTQIAKRRRIPLIDVGTVDLIRRGLIAVHPGIDHFANDGVVFTDGVFQSYDAVVLATGYRPCVDGFLSGVEGMSDANGTPLVSGAVTPWPGLYFCGFSITATGMLREIGLEARCIAESIGPPHAG